MEKKLLQLENIINAYKLFLKQVNQDPKYKQYLGTVQKLVQSVANIYNSLVLYYSGMPDAINSGIENFTINNDWLNELNSKPINIIYLNRNINPKEVIGIAYKIMNSSEGKKITNGYQLTNGKLLGTQNIEFLKKRYNNSGNINEASKKSQEHKKPGHEHVPQSQQLVRMLSFRIVPKYFKKIEGIADDKNTTVSALIRTYIRDGMKKDLQSKGLDNEFRIE